MFFHKSANDSPSRTPGGLEADFRHLSAFNMTEYVLDDFDITGDLQRHSRT